MVYESIDHENGAMMAQVVFLSFARAIFHKTPLAMDVKNSILLSKTNRQQFSMAYTLIDHINDVKNVQNFAVKPLARGSRRSRGDYSTILTEAEVNNCFSIYTRSDLNRIKKETTKTTISLIHGWIYAWTSNRKQQMHNSWIFTVFSNMANHSFNVFVSFSMNDWKENVESLNNSPFWEDTQSFQLASVNSLWMRQFLCRFLQMLSTAANDRGERCLSAVQCSLPC